MSHARTRPAALLLCLALAARGPALAAQKPPPAKAPAPGIRLNFQAASLGTVLQHLSDSAGLTIITEAPIDGRITMVSRQPLSVDDTITLLNSALKQRGYAAIQTGRVLKILPIAEAKKANIPVRSGSDPAAITPSDRMVTQVIPLRYVDAAKLQKDLGALIPEYANLAANASSNALILTDTEANVRRIVEIVSALDTSKAGVSEVKVFPLKYADATSAAALINKVFEVETTQSRQQSSRSPLMRFFGRRGGPPGSQDQDTSDAFQQQKTTAAADQRTNTVVVSGTADTLKVVETVVRELDANPADEQDVLIYRLKNANAANLQKVLNELFKETDNDATARRTSSQPAQADPRAQRRQPMAPTASRVSESAAASAADLAGQVRVVADEDTNSLMLMAPPKHFAKLRTILGELDRPIAQVLIKVLIAEVTHQNDKDLGVEFSALNIRSSGRGSQVFTDFGVAAETDGLIFKMVEKDVTAALRALEQVGHLEVLSRPYILASDNKEANITVGQEVPFIRDTRTTETGQTINTIQYEDIGIILKVTPHINPEGLVIMDVVPEISTLTGTTVPISETVNAQVFAKRSASSRVAIRDGQTIVIGGLMEDRKTNTVRRVPILGSAPLIGALFRRTITVTSKTELLIFLTPHVAREAGDLKTMSEGEEKRTKLVPDAVAPGTFDAHMKGMRGHAAEEPTPKPKP